MLRIKIKGVVQGIGFRPFIYRLAGELELKGYVANTTSGVEIEVSGAKKDINAFLERIKKEHPPTADIKQIIIQEEGKDVAYSTFSIKESIDKKGWTLISPDLAVCPDCLKEMDSPEDRRYKYAFINCTNCGPRYSVIEDLPYDRPKTTMKKFEMCDYCSKEYSNPLNRRFHAQPIACPECGPQLKLLDRQFKEVKGDPVENTIKFLLQGRIVGIKGIGGFHIACDPANEKTVAELRKRKNRPHKPFAIMVHPDKIHTIVQCDKAQFEILQFLAAPIVILRKQRNGVRPSLLTSWKLMSNEGLTPFLENAAPDNNNLGVFLPYAPVHYMILNEKLPCLIMTSGNIQDEPIAVDEKDLKGLCDYYLTNNRPIKNRSDDSIIMPFNKGNIMVRRSRGFVPLPFDLPFAIMPTLACGAELKLTFSLGNEKTLFISP